MAGTGISGGDVPAGKKKIYAKVFWNYERFWHWSQAVLILTLLVTGARLHGFFEGTSWETAFRVHLIAAGLLFVLWVFTVFWHFATGEWMQYMPTGRNLMKVARFYAWGIFLGESHPSKPTTRLKHNPLQRISYLLLTLLIAPAIWATGTVYLLVAWLPLPLDWVAWAHVVAAYAMALFVVVHVYMATTGPTVFAYLRHMITGYAWVIVDEDRPTTAPEALVYRRDPRDRD